MDIPKQITIGEKTYRVKIKQFVDLFNKNINGNINYSGGMLKIKKSSDIRVMEEVFFHELAHGIMKEMEFNYPKITKFRNDEVFTQELGLILRKMFLELLEKQKIKAT